MIVNCERCASQFQLDEEKVPVGGTKVRCSRCQHAFVVSPPGLPDEDLAETWVRETLGGERAEPDAFGADPDGDSDESDWQFNEDPRPGEAEPELDAARQAVESLLGGAPEAEAQIATPAEFAGLDLDDGVDDFGAEADPLDVEGELDFGADPPEAADPLDEPSNWNLLDGDPSPASPTSYVAVPAPDSAQTRVAAAPEPRGIAQPLVGLPGSADAARESSWVARFGAIGGWAVVAAGIAMCLYGGLVAEPTPAPTVSSYAGDGFEIDGIQSHWIDNASAGPVFVISGRMRRAEGTSPWDAVPLEIQLLDGSGAPIDGTRTAIGPEIPARYLRESSPQELRALQHSRARQFSAFAGTWLAFDAVVGRLPDRAQRFAFSPSPKPIPTIPTAP